MRAGLEFPALEFSEFGVNVSRGCHQRCRFKFRWGLRKGREESGDNLQMSPYKEELDFCR